MGVGLENAPRTPPAVNASHPPPQMDMLTMLPRGWAWIRFVADNPGVWPWHCHIAWHLQMGMLMLFMVAPEQIPLP
jgi:FtsP/CotA-like multicopper oxidase with cupredoxin domain